MKRIMPTANMLPGVSLIILRKEIGVILAIKIVKLSRSDCWSRAFMVSLLDCSTTTVDSRISLPAIMLPDGQIPRDEKLSRVPLMGGHQ